MTRASRPRGAPIVAVTARLLRAWPLPDPDDAADKDARGRVLVIGGSREIPGAAWLAATAAMRAGAGKLQVATVRDVAIPLAIALPEARVIGVRANRDGDIARIDAPLRRSIAAAHAIVVGPGAGDTKASTAVARDVLRHARGIVVVDAGALSATHDGANAAATPILTPHHGEMAALLGIARERIDADPERCARETARAMHAVIVLKAATTIVAAPDGRAWRHDGGTVALATSGSGDVLAGLIAGLAARGARPEQAAVWAVRLHALAGARLVRRGGPVGLLARELPGEIPALMRDAAR